MYENYRNYRALCAQRLSYSPAIFPWTKRSNFHFSPAIAQFDSLQWVVAHSGAVVANFVCCFVSFSPDQPPSPPASNGLLLVECLRLYTCIFSGRLKNTLRTQAEQHKLHKFAIKRIKLHINKKKKNIHTNEYTHVGKCMKLRLS